MTSELYGPNGEQLNAPPPPAEGTVKGPITITITADDPAVTGATKVLWTRTYVEDETPQFEVSPATAVAQPSPINPQKRMDTGMCVTAVQVLWRGPLLREVAERRRLQQEATVAPATSDGAEPPTPGGEPNPS